MLEGLVLRGISMAIGIREGLGGSRVDPAGLWLERGRIETLAYLIPETIPVQRCPALHQILGGSTFDFPKRNSRGLLTCLDEGAPEKGQKDQESAGVFKVVQARGFYRTASISSSQ